MRSRYAQTPQAGSGAAGAWRFGEAPGVLLQFVLFLVVQAPWPWRGGPAPQRGGAMALAAGHGRARRPQPPERRHGGPDAGVASYPVRSMLVNTVSTAQG